MGGILYIAKYTLNYTERPCIALKASPFTSCNRIEKFISTGTDQVEYIDEDKDNPSTDTTTTISHLSTRRETAVVVMLLTRMTRMRSGCYDNES